MPSLSALANLLQATFNQPPDYFQVARRQDLNDDITVTAGSGNVFADLGFDNSDEERLKAQLVREIRDILKGRSMTQVKAADLLGLEQPDVSALVNGSD